MDNDQIMYVSLEFFSSVFSFLQTSVHLLQKSFRENMEEAAALKQSYHRLEEHWGSGKVKNKYIKIRLVAKPDILCLYSTEFNGRAFLWLCDHKANHMEFNMIS